MFSRLHPLFFGTSLLTLAVFLIILVLGEDQLSPQMGIIHIGFVWGSILAQTILAATWTSLGPFSLPTRFSLSFLWLTIIAAEFHFLIYRMSPDLETHYETILLICLCILIQWLVIQIPLWSLLFFTGLRLQNPEETSPSLDQSYRQFGIRQLITFTAIVSVLLASGRMAAPLVKDRLIIEITTSIGIYFTFISTSLIMFPLLLAGLLNYRRRWAVGLALVFIVAATVIEIPWFIQLTRGPANIIRLQIISQNITSALWILTVTYLARRSGYQLIKNNSHLTNAATLP